MKKSLSSVLFLIVISVTAQRSQRFAYIDMQYILENVPEYLTAQNTLDDKVAAWTADLNKLKSHIETLKLDLANEKEILTEDLLEEKEDEITLKEEELNRLESLYFGPNGDMFLLRKQLVKPIQDQVYNAIQEIATKNKYDFVLDKSSEPVMLFSNKKYDISELVLNTIARDKKIKERKEKREEFKNKRVSLSKSQKSNTIGENKGSQTKNEDPKEEKLLSKEQKDTLAKKEEQQVKKEEEKNNKKKQIEEARKKRLADLKAKRDLLRKKKQKAREKKKQEKKEEDNEENKDKNN